MVDIDIPTNNPPETSTLLHWLQTSLVPSTTPTQLNTTSGPIRAFLLQISSTFAAPIVPYFGPNPPARIPLSHRYVQILVDTSPGLTLEQENALREAARTEQRGFNAEAVLERAGLSGKVVAGNFYNVTNPGPAASPTMTTASDSGSATLGTGAGESIGGGGALATGTESSTGSVQTGAVNTGAAGSRGAGLLSVAWAACFVIGTMMLGL